MRNKGAPAGPPVQKSVLMLDDNPQRCLSLRTALAAAGFAVDSAGDPDLVDDKLDLRRPDLVLVDLQIPGRDTLGLAHTLLVDPRLEGVPIFALTAEDAAGPPPQEAEDLFDGYIGAPVEPAELIARIQALFAPPGGRGGSAAPPPESAGAEAILESIERGLPESQHAPSTSASLGRLAASIAPPEKGALPGYLAEAEKLADFRTVRAATGFRSLVRLCREVLGRDPDPAPEFDALRGEYLENRAAELNVLAKALRRSDFPALARAGHNLKGTGAAYGFAELTELGRAIETAAKEQDGRRTETLLGKTEFYLTLVRPRAAH